jgi:hypothetical protein
MDSADKLRRALAEDWEFVGDQNSLCQLLREEVLRLRATLQRVAMMADTGSKPHKQEFQSYYSNFDTPSGWRVAERMREVANDVVGNLPVEDTSTPYDRVVREKRELDEKIQRLIEFITRSIKFAELPTEERRRLINQHGYMCSYSDTLADRIQSFDCGQEVPEIEDLRIYKRAMDSMAAQFIHPKMTAREMAEMQLKGASHAE